MRYGTDMVIPVLYRDVQVHLATMGWHCYTRARDELAVSVQRRMRGVNIGSMTKVFRSTL